MNLDPTVNFTIRESVDRAVDYSLPYTAFDLVATAPLVNGSTSHYSPLKRASNPSDYVLGKVFSHETHIVVDYERAVFNLSQAYHQGGSKRIVPIIAPGDPTTSVTALDPSSSKYGSTSTSLSSGAPVEIAVGVTAFVLIAIALVFAWRRRWSIFRVKKQIPEPSEKAELGGDAKPWTEAMSQERSELETQESSGEVAGS